MIKYVIYGALGGVIGATLANIVLWFRRRRRAKQLEKIMALAEIWIDAPNLPRRKVIK